jgi:hypothetical protein
MCINLHHLWSTLVPRSSFINCWSLINIHLAIYNPYALMFVGVSSTTTLPNWCFYYIFRYTLSSKVISSSCLLLDIFFSMFYTSNPYFKILVFTSISMIPTYVAFIDWIISGKFIVHVENNSGFITKMISSFSFVMPFW